MLFVVYCFPLYRSKGKKVKVRKLLLFEQDKTIQCKGFWGRIVSSEKKHSYFMFWSFLTECWLSLLFFLIFPLCSFTCIRRSIFFITCVLCTFLETFFSKLETVLVDPFSHVPHNSPSSWHDDDVVLYSTVTLCYCCMLSTWLLATSITRLMTSFCAFSLYASTKTLYCKV